MVWLYPAALLGLFALALPLLIHLLVHRRAERLLFPTLRFVRPTRLASIRRQLIDDVPLLLVRAAIVAAAAAAVAGPLVVTPARRATWKARVVRAIVVDAGVVDARVQQEASTAFRSTVIQTTSVAEGLRRAVGWLREAPPATREIVALSPFPISSVSGADMAAIPSDVGIRFVRAGSLPAVLTEGARPSLGPSADSARAERHARSVVLDGERTRVLDLADGDAMIPVAIEAPEDSRSAAGAALAAVLSQRVLAPAPDRAARLVLVGAPAYASALSAASPVRLAWMADAVAAIARDEQLSAAARSIAGGLTDRRFTRPPWQPLFEGSAPIAAAAADGARLLIVSAAPVRDVASPLLLRAIFNSLAPRNDLSRGEVLPIPDADLRAWERRAAPVDAPDLSRAEKDDRRWLWGAALALLAVEAWLRRKRARSAAALSARDRSTEVADVA
jgi:hypothetical protein